MMLFLEGGTKKERRREDGRKNKGRGRGREKQFLKLERDGGR